MKLHKFCNNIQDFDDIKRLKDAYDLLVQYIDSHMQNNKVSLIGHAVLLILYLSHIIELLCFVQLKLYKSMVSFY